MQRTLNDPSTNHPEEIDGMEVFHPYSQTAHHRAAGDGPSHPEYELDGQRGSAVGNTNTITSDGLMRDTDRTLVQPKSRGTVGLAFERERVGAGGGGLQGKVFR